MTTWGKKIKMKLFQNELSKFFTLKYFNSMVDFLADMFTFF